MSESLASVVGSRLDGLRYVLPGAYATFFVVLAADATRLQPFEESHFRTEWVVVGLLVAFLFGYVLHLVAIRGTRKRKNEGDLSEFEELSYESPQYQGPPRGPHDVVNVLRSNSRLQWAEVRPLVLSKFNRLTGRKVALRELDSNEKLRWFVYHFCFSYILKAGAAAEAESSRSQFDLVRAFGVALWVGFGASLIALAAIAIRAHAFGPVSQWWEAPLGLALMVGGLVAPFALGGLLREQQDRASKRLAGAVYEAFLAS